MLDKPRIWSLILSVFNKFNKHEHSCTILYFNIIGENKTLPNISEFTVIMTYLTLVGYGALRGVSSVLNISGSASSGFSTIDSEYWDWLTKLAWDPPRTSDIITLSDTRLQSRVWNLKKCSSFTHPLHKHPVCYINWQSCLLRNVHFNGK